jgi:hypothetical protein
MIIFMQGMADISKKEFAELAIDGRNYLTWAMDVKINLAARTLIGTITTPAQGAQMWQNLLLCTLFDTTLTLL